jgi:hypothetical protein
LLIILSSIKILKRLATLFSLLAICALEAQAQVALVFNCTRTEKDYTENYELRIQPVTKTQKAKIFLDGRDLDRIDEDGRQTVKTVLIANPSILIIIEAFFDPEVMDGITYSAGKVSTEITINQTTGKLIKVETIQGGILGAHLGNGTKISEEHCLSLLAQNP